MVGRLNSSVAQRARKSFRSFILLKPISAVIGLLVIVLLSRGLTPVEYGLYFAILAVVEIVILVSNFGLIAGAYRFVSADESGDGTLRVNGPVGVLVIARVVTLVGAFLVGLSLVTILPETYVNRIVPAEFVIVLGLIIFGEGLARYVEAIFDSLLLQAKSLLSLIARSAVRLGGNAYFVFEGRATLETVMFVECVAVGVGVLVSMAMLLPLISIRRIDVYSVARWFESERIRRFIRFVLPAFGAQVIGIAYGVDVLKLSLNWFAGPEEVAVFGFAFALVSVVLRYMPAALFAGWLRPVFVASATKDDGFRRLASISNLALKLNMTFILGVLVIVAAGGEKLSVAISGGKFKGAEFVMIVLLLSAFMIGTHLIQSIQSLAVEDSSLALKSTVCAVITMPVAFIFALKYGAVGVAAYIFLSEAIWVFAFRKFMIFRGVFVEWEWVSFAKIFGGAILIVTISVMINNAGLSWLWALSASVAVFVYVFCFSGVYSRSDVEQVRRIVPVRFVRFVGG